MTDEHDPLEKLLFDSILDAQMAVDLLEANGIKARLVEDASVVGLRGKTEVWVRQADSARAIELLQGSGGT